MLRKIRWSPYVCGVVIGLLQIPIFLILGASIGTSVSFNSVACVVLGKGGTTGCFALPKHWWQLGFVIGIVIGAFISRKLSGGRGGQISEIWTKILKTELLWPRMIMAFLGGFIFILGARLADGCTSGNGISGIALLFPGSFIVIASMFISGILVSLLYPKV